MDITAYQHMRISTRGKRPLRNLTPGDKVRAIQRIHNGETKASVSRDIGVPESTLRGWCKNEQKLRFMCRQLGATITDQGVSVNVNGMDNPPEKRSKLVDAFDFNHSYNYDRLGSLSSANRLNTACLSDSKSNGFISNNVVEELLKKTGTSKDEVGKQIFGDSAFLQGMNALSAAANYSQMPLIQNINLLSFLNPSIAVSDVNTNSKSDCGPGKTTFTASTISKEIMNKPKKQSTPVSVKSWAHESLCSPFNENNDNNHKMGIDDVSDTNDSNNNDVRPTYSLPPPASINEFVGSTTLFPIGMPLPPVPPISTESRSDALLQWSKVFNASLSFLALATAAAAIQCPTSVSPSAALSAEIKCNVSAESSRMLHSMQGHITAYTPPLLDHSEDSNFESEPEDLSIRSGTSKVSSSANSRPQSSTKDMLSDSVTLSDDEH